MLGIFNPNFGKFGYRSITTFFAWGICIKPNSILTIIEYNGIDYADDCNPRNHFLAEIIGVGRINY